MNRTNLAIFASGNGTNAEAIINYFKDHQDIQVGGLLSNNPNAYAIQRAQNHFIPHMVVNRTEFKNPAVVLEQLDHWSIDAIILAGFLWLIPEYLIVRFQDRILNIHPALLPKFGGKGMYGSHVHQAVLASGEKETGITIHLVNQHYDEGEIIFQKSCQVNEDDTQETLAAKVHQLEHKYYPAVIEDWLAGKYSNQS